MKMTGHLRTSDFLYVWVYEIIKLHSRIKSTNQ